MLVSPPDRVGLASLAPDIYVEHASWLARRMLVLPDISASIVCGSVVKGDVVPEWSDIDLVIVTKGPVGPSLLQIRNILIEAHARQPIPVGADVTSMEEFMRTGRIGGRPLAMTQEVAAYGIALGVEDIFDRCARHFGDPSYPGRLAAETPLLWASQVHNWRRTISSNSCELEELGSIAIKTTLKLLKYASGPLTKAPFTYAGALEHLVQTLGASVQNQGFAEAINARLQWPQLKKEPLALSEVTTRIVEFLNAQGTEWNPGT